MIENHNGPTVTASDIGQAARCPHALYLAKQGLRPDQANQQAMARGDRKHESWTRAQEPGGVGKWLKVCVQLVIFVGGAMIVWTIAAGMLAG